MKYVSCLIVMLLLVGCTSYRFGNDPKAIKLNQLVIKAEKASSKDNYIKAVQCYVDAILEAEDVAPEHVHEIKSELASTYLDWARSLYWEAKKKHSVKTCQKAIAMAGRAASIDPKREVRCRMLIDKLNKEMSSIKFRNETSLSTLDPGNKERSMKIALLCKQGAVFYESKQYTRSRDKYEEVLVIDPFNLEAIRGLKKVMRELKSVGSKRREVSKAERVAEIEWNYVQAIAEKEKAAQESQLDNLKKATLEEKLSDLYLKEINFEALPMDKVFTILEKEIAAALKIDFKFEFKGMEPKDKKFPPVSFKVAEIPADKAIEVICEALKLSYKYDKNKIVISPL